MTKEKLDQDSVNEDLTTPAHPDVATAGENLSANSLFQQTKVPSLGRMIFPVIDMNGPTGSIFNIKHKPSTNDFQLLRSEVEVYNSEAIKTGITQEAIQDMRSQYGKSADNVIGQLLRGLANDQENTKTLGFLTAQSLASTSLTLSNPLNARDNVMELTQKIHTLILEANKDNKRTFHAYAVLPYNPAASFLALNSFTGGEGEPGDDGLFLGSIGHTSFFMNPDPAATEAFVGLKDKNPSKSSAIFSPYESNVISSVDPDSGDLVCYLFNRFAITESPLHITGEEMMFKFEIL